MAAQGPPKLAEAVVAACEKPSNFEFLYPLDWPIKEKIETIATKIYGADGVDYSPEAEEQIDDLHPAGLRQAAACAWPRPTSA